MLFFNLLSYKAFFVARLFRLFAVISFTGPAYLKEEFEADSRPKGADIRRRLQKPDAKGGHRLFSLRMRPHALPRPAGGV